MGDPVKIPTRDPFVNLDNPGIDIEQMQNLLFENLSSLELTKFTKHDTVEGINPFYNVISNLSSINREFDPISLLSATKSSNSLFDVYGIDLINRLPEDGNYAYIGDNPLIPGEYGNIVINLNNMGPNESVEIEIDSSGTIYRVRS
jgi:hypothetical protein